MICQYHKSVNADIWNSQSWMTHVFFCMFEVYFGLQVISLLHVWHLSSKRQTTAKSLSYLTIDDPLCTNAGHICVIMDHSKPMSWTVGRAHVEPLFPTGWKCSAGVLHCTMSVSWCSDEAARIMPNDSNDTWLTTCIYIILYIHKASGEGRLARLVFRFASQKIMCSWCFPDFNAWLLLRSTIPRWFYCLWLAGGMAFPERHSAVALWEISQQDLGQGNQLFAEYFHREKWRVPIALGGNLFAGTLNTICVYVCFLHMFPYRMPLPISGGFWRMCMTEVYLEEHQVSVLQWTATSAWEYESCVCFSIRRFLTWWYFKFCKRFKSFAMKQSINVYIYTVYIICRICRSHSGDQESWPSRNHWEALQGSACFLISCSVIGSLSWHKNLDFQNPSALCPVFFPLLCPKIDHGIWSKRLLWYYW